MNEQAMEKRLGGIEGLPTLPMVLQQLQKVLRNPYSNMAQIAAVVSKDQALTSRVIRLVNSAWYSRSTRVVSVQQAIVTLGLETLNNLMIGLSVVKMFDRSGIYQFNPQKFWEHSFATALGAERLAQLTNYQGERSDCFVGGLLHDMGRLVLEQFLHDDYTRAQRNSQDKKQPLLCTERDVFGFTHADAGAWLGNRWNIPEQLVVIMKHHHAPELAVDLLPQQREVLKLVTIANELCIQNCIGESGERYTTTTMASTLPLLTKDVQRSLLDHMKQQVSATLKEWQYP